MATQKVQIQSALWYKSQIKGTFPLVKGFKADADSKRDGYIWIEAAFGNSDVAKTVRVAVSKGDFTVIGEKSKGKVSKSAKATKASKKVSKATVKARTAKVSEASSFDSSRMTDSQIEAEITDRFEVMELLTQAVIDRTVKSMIVSGAAGIGKTYTIDRMLLDAEHAGKVSKFSMMTGSCTAIGLYLQLWNHQNAGNVLVLDDIDSIFDDQEALNLLKGALDTGRQRVISWLGAGKFLESEGAESTFEFNGTVIFITNHNFDDRIARGGKMAVHYEALISRCMYLDLGIHSMREVVVRIKQVVRKTSMMSDMGITKEQTDMMLDWMTANANDLRKVDLRTMIKLAQAMKTSRYGWQKIARAALCRR